MGLLRKFRRAAEGRKAIRSKTGILLCLPSLDGWSRSEQLLRALFAGIYTVKPDWPYLVEPYLLLNRAPVEDARNECSGYFMEHTDHEYLMFWDADQVPLSDSWFNLIGKADICSGLTFMWDANRKVHQRLQFNQFRVDENGINRTVMPEGKDPYEVDIVGTACMAIHRRVFEKLGARPFKVGRPEGRETVGEDVDFCNQARAAGFKIVIDPNVIFEHVKPVGLLAVYQTIAACADIAKRAGYQQALLDARNGTIRPEMLVEGPIEPASEESAA